MKIRIFKKLQNGVFDVRVQTEDWSENDRGLMVRHGEPEIDLGGAFVPNGETSDSSSKDAIAIPTVYARVMTESPFTHKFDTRDFNGSVQVALAVAQLWASAIECRVTSAVLALRAKDDKFTTEEVSEV